MGFKFAASLLAALLLTSSLAHGFLEAADYSDYSEDARPVEENEYEDLGTYDSSPYGDYSDFFDDDLSADMAVTEDHRTDESQPRHDDWSSDYEGMEQEVDDLDTFFWSDHLDKFGGSAVKAEQGLVSQKQNEDEEDTGHIPGHLRTQVDVVTWWIRGTDFHRDYWPVKVNLSLNKLHLKKQLEQSLSTPEGWLKERSTPGWPPLTLTTNEFIPADEVIMAIPLPVAVSPALGGVALADVPSSSELLGSSSITPAAILAAWLLRERSKGEDSKWAAYLKLLPERVPLPFLWTEEQLQEFDFIPVMKKIRDQARYVDTLYLKLDSSLLAGASLHQFEDALSVVWSRHVLAAPLANEESLGESSGDSAKGDTSLLQYLVPLGDLAGTSITGKATWQVQEFEEGEFLCLTAVSDINEGEEIQVAIEGADGTQYLMHRGAVLPRNLHDEFVVFGPTDQVVSYFADNFIKGDSVPRQQGIRENRSSKGKSATAGEVAVAREKFKTRALKLANEAVNLLVPSQESGKAPAPFMFGSNGFIDPGLWAVYAVCSFLKDNIGKVETAELNVGIVVRLAMDMSGQAEGVTCSTILGLAKLQFPSAPEEELQDAVEAVSGAALYLQQLAGVWLDGFRTSFEEDQELLTQSMQCVCGGEEGVERNGGQQGQCPPSCAVKTLKFEQELAVRFRMSRKHLLLSVMKYLHRNCQHTGQSVQ